MPISRRTILAAGASSVVTAAASASVQDDPAIEKAIAELVQRSQEANAALLRSDVDRYRELITLAEDFTLMSPFGGRPSRGTEITDETWDAMRRFFRNGTLRQEVVQAYGSAEMVVLAVIEHGHGEVGSLPGQDWPLRVTLVYRRKGADWHLAHRHADPLARGISLKEAALLANGPR
ncbi:YybH family protein [Paracoccus aestuariivivens]|uniref:DUF4440 domain-containing protein n=1 Tax=Paracoccus aestuariivivens TaxID=1820333 RepID=A0A6L6JF43_9RHOB|nr:nuclear transport factor 2 family protein [Paracoccus aestuariivivens]MTH80176.1 DUF4440 domain-containing protein [Paracoccus aestuariivivens]